MGEEDNAGFSCDAFSPFMSRGGPFAEWDMWKVNAGLLGNEHFS